MFSIVTVEVVDQDADRERQAAERHGIERVAEEDTARRATPGWTSGIEIMTTRVDRHEPRNSRIISAVSPAAIAPSRTTPTTEFVTNTD